jgi:CRP-like cAMP-binding protein
MSAIHLDQLDIFQGFSAQQIAKLKPLFVLLYAPKDSVVFEQNDLADKLYLLVEGEVAIHYKPDDGPALIIARIRAQGVFGWSAAIGNLRYTSSAICLSDCQMWRICGGDLRRLCESDPNTGALFLERLAALIAERLRTTHPQLLELLERGLTANIEKPASAR